MTDIQQVALNDMIHSTKMCMSVGTKKLVFPKNDMTQRIKKVFAKKNGPTAISQVLYKTVEIEKYPLYPKPVIKTEIMCGAKLDFEN